MRITAPLLRGCRAIDALNDALAWVAAVAVLAACLISAGNAVIRYLWDWSSNGWLEVQWYLFAATVMLGAPQVLRRNEHVRVDILYARLRGRWAVALDLGGLLIFLLPAMLLLMVLSWPMCVRAWISGEVSSNAGGLVRWPVLALLPLGFALISLQAMAECVKRLAYLAGSAELDTQYARPLQ